MILALGLLFGAWAGGLARALPPQQAATPTPGGTVGLPQGGDGSAVPGQVLVRFRTSPSNAAQQPSQATNILRTAGIQSSVRRSLQTPGVYLLNVPSGSESAAVAALAARPDVQTADPNLTRHIHMRPAAPSDPLYPMQWGFARVNAPAAWNAAQLYNVTVAVLDTGLDLGHPEFAARTVEGANFVNPGSPPQDDNGHGTHISGIIAAAANNGIGGVGLAWQAQVMPIKVADSAGNLTSEAWLNGLAWAVQHGAQVVNMSFGGSSTSATEQAAIDDAWNRGAVIVASAGNSGDGANQVEYPASYNNVVSVAATGNDNSHAYYSEHNSYVTLAAPGGDARFGNDPDGRFIVSTWPRGLGSAYQSGYEREIGTSQAAPFVSGLAALMLSTSAAWTNRTLVARMETTATDLGPPGRDDSFGFGLINAVAAVGNPPGPSSPGSTPTATPAPPTVQPTPQPTSAPTAAPTVPVRTGCLFADACQGDPFLPFVEDLVSRGAVAGYSDHTFRPLNNLTRGEVAKIIALTGGFELTTATGPHFTDVPPTDPYYPYIETAFAQGLISGYRDGSFRPYGVVSRGQLAKMIVLTRSWDLLDPGRSSFTDVAYGDTFYYYIETAVKLQVVLGYNDNTFRPNAPTTRAEATKIIDVALATFRPHNGP
ncbi:MAG: S8 family serine peptidase [Chloroflexia bacterium]